VEDEVDEPDVVLLLVVFERRVLFGVDMGVELVDKERDDPLAVEPFSVALKLNICTTFGELLSNVELPDDDDNRDELDNSHRFDAKLLIVSAPFVGLVALMPNMLCVKPTSPICNMLLLLVNCCLFNDEPYVPNWI